jgi:hypothetical protein
MSNTVNPNNPDNKQNRARMLNSNIAPIGLEDYSEYRLNDLYTEKQARPAYNFSENCRQGDSHATDLLECHDPNDPLTNTLFSKKNIQIIQNGIRATVHKETNQVIAQQDETQILLIIRYVYYTYCKNLAYNIQEQIKDLNNRVIKYVVPLVVGELKQYTTYIQDSFSTLRPQNYPDQTTSYGQRQFSMFPEF